MATRILSGAPPITRQPSSPIHMHVVAYGENNYVGHGGSWTIHAEDAALHNLPTLPKKRHLKRINLIVTRTSKSGNWCASKPCMHCILALMNKLPSKGWQLDTVYYTEPGMIVETSLKELRSDDNPHVSMYYKATGYAAAVAW